MSREYKSTPFALFTKDGTGKRTRAGIFAVMGNRDSYGDRIKAGAFTKTFREAKADALHLFNHDFNAPPTAKVEELYELGKSDLPEALLAKYPDATGGAVVVRTYLKTPRGDEMLAALDAGAITKMSFAYEVPKGKAEMIEEKLLGEVARTRMIHEVRHYESSDVLFPANSATLATLSLPLFKSFIAEAKAGLLDQAELLALKEALDAVLSIEQPKTEHPIIPAVPNPLGAQLAFAAVRMRQLEFDSRAGHCLTHSL